MAKYTIEDIEIIRQKSGISYEEAVNLLEYHSGSLARALVDLEKNGRLRDVKGAKTGGGRRGGNVLNKLYRLRVVVKKGDVTIVNISVLFMAFACMMAFWVPMIGIIVALALGYRVSMDRGDRDFSGESFENMVKNASDNVKKTVKAVVSEFEDAAKPSPEGSEEPVKREEPRGETAASGTIPVNVQFPDGGSVEVKEDQDGFHEADIQ